MTNYLREHAEREFALLEEGALFYPSMERLVLDVLDVIADQGHSGMSIGVLLDLVVRLAQLRHLAPLTDDPAEWREVGTMGFGRQWQNKRNSACFSKDGGVSYTCLDDKVEDGIQPLHFTEKVNKKNGNH